MTDETTRRRAVVLSIPGADCPVCAQVVDQLLGEGFEVMEGDLQSAAEAVTEVREALAAQGGAAPVVMVGGRVYGGADVAAGRHVEEERNEA
jgi:hypothetical protein